MTQATLFGGAAAVLVAFVYGIFAYPFDISWGLIVVGLIGGVAIGYATVRGAFGGRFHLVVPGVRWLAAIIAVLAWLGASLVSYVASQILLPAATTPLLDRLSVGGLLEDLNGTVFSPSILGLAAMAFMAWRSAR